MARDDDATQRRKPNKPKRKPPKKSNLGPVLIGLGITSVLLVLVCCVGGIFILPDLQDATRKMKRESDEKARLAKGGSTPSSSPTTGPTAKRTYTRTYLDAWLRGTDNTKSSYRYENIGTSGKRAVTSVKSVEDTKAIFGAPDSSKAVENGYELIYLALTTDNGKVDRQVTIRFGTDSLGSKFSSVEYAP